MSEYALFRLIDWISERTGLSEGLIGFVTIWNVGAIIAVGLFEITYDPTYRARCRYLRDRMDQVFLYGPGSAERLIEHRDDQAEFARRGCAKTLK